MLEVIRLSLPLWLSLWWLSMPQSVIRFGDWLLSLLEPNLRFQPRNPLVIRIVGLVSTIF